MKIQIFSDLHIDASPIKTLSVLEGVEAVVVAGDTCEGALCAFAASAPHCPAASPGRDGDGQPRVLPALHSR